MAKNYENLIISSADVSMNILVNGVMISVDTGVQLQANVAQDTQEIFAISQTDPIGIKRLNRRFTGSLSIQAGENEQILDAINAILPTPIASLCELSGFSLTWTLKMGTVAEPRQYNYALNNVSVSSDDFSVDRNSPETQKSFNFTALQLVRKVVTL